MKKLFKKIVVLFLTVSMFLCSLIFPSFVNTDSLLTIKAHAATNNVEGCFTYTVNENGNATIIDCDTSISGSVTIPSTFNGYPVTNIDSLAFYNCVNITSISIPDSVTNIEDSTFCSCTNLTSIKVASGNQYYSNDDYGVLFNKSKTELISYPIGNMRTSYTIPDSVINIGESSFKKCANITSILIPNNVTNISNYAFQNCINLTNITIPDSVIKIGWSAFEGCSSLSDVSIGKGVTQLGFLTFSKCTSLESIVIPGTVRVIINNTFSGCTGLKSLVLCEGVEEIGYWAFSECTSLTDVILPDSIAIIDEHAFAYCTKLNNIVLSSNITNMGIRAFYDTAYYNDESNWENGVLYLENCLLAANSDIPVSYEIKSGTKIIADSAFSSCSNLINVTIPDSVTTIPYCAFSNCVNLTNIVIPDSVETIGAMAFKECSNLVNIILPDSITNIYYDAFYKSGYYNDESNWENNILYVGKHLVASKSGIPSLCEINAGTKTIAMHSFYYREELTDVIIPNSVTNISSSAFSYCKNLTNVYYTGTEAEWNAMTIGDSNDSLLDATIHFNYIIPERNIYNHGEETYSFDNYSDLISDGHCFGISITSSGYYLGELDVSKIKLNSPSELYSVNLSADVKEPICYYQQIQGSKRNRSTVAGGSWYLYGYNDISADWADVVDYVKNHEYDGKGNLQIGFRGVQWGGNSGGHAINFLRYENVNGQDRIYAYDNNFPEIETYFYQDSDGNIKQTPYETFAVSIDCISLRSIPLYFTLANEADTTRYIYAEKDTISIDGASAYVMDGEVGMDEQVMFEIPANFEHVIITPLVNNAKFTYLNNEYSFGNFDGDTVGIFKLATINGDSEQNIGLTIINKSEIPEISIKSPSTTTINYGDKIIFHADLTRILPNGWEVKWTASNGNFSYSVSDDGTTCTISPSSSGDTIFTASVVDANGNIISTDEQIMTSKAGFFQKIIAFFKKLFGLTKTIPQIYKGTL